MPKNALQIKAETLILELFKQNKFDRRSVLKTLLYSYIPEPNTSSFGFLINTFNSLAYIRRNQGELVTKMLAIINKGSTQDNESKTNDADLSVAELFSLFELINDRTLTVESTGSFVAILNAYFYFFPEDRNWVRLSSPVDMYLTKEGFHTDFIDSLRTRLHNDPYDLIREYSDELVMHSVIGTFLAELTDTEVLDIAKKLITKAAEIDHSYKAVDIALGKLVEHPSSTHRTEIRSYVYKAMFKKQENAAGLTEVRPRQNPWQLPLIAEKSFESASEDKSAEADRSYRIFESCQWFEDHLRDDKEAFNHQRESMPLYYINALVPSANQEQINDLARAVIPIFKIHNPNMLPAISLKDSGYPHSTSLVDAPLNKLLIEIAAKASSQTAKLLDNALRAEVNYGKSIKIPSGEEFFSNQTVAGFMILAMQKHLRPIIPGTRETTSPAPFILHKEAPEAKMDSADDYLQLLLQQHHNPDYDFIKLSKPAIVSEWKKEKIIEAHKAYAVQEYLRLAKDLSSPKKIEHMRKIHALPVSADKIKVHLMTELHSMNQQITHIAAEERSHDHSRKVPI